MEKLCQEKGFFLSDLVLLTILLSTEECVHMRVEGGLMMLIWLAEPLLLLSPW